MTSSTATTRRTRRPRGQESQAPQGTGSGFGAKISYAVAGSMLSLLFVVPLLWAVVRSFQPDSVIGAPLTLHDFTRWTSANYSRLFGSNQIMHYVWNSLICAGATAALTAVVATLAGYAFGRPKFRFPGAGVSFSIILVTMMIPFQAILTPLFLELHAMHLTNNLLGLILFYTTYNLPFGVFVMRNTFAQIPQELEDAAAVDGAGVLRTLIAVLRPLIVPGIATTVLYAFIFSWTEFLGALTFITSQDKFTLPVALLNIETRQMGQVSFGILEAGAVIALIPCVILYVSLQRYYVRGLSSGAVKG